MDKGKIYIFLTAIFWSTSGLFVRFLDLPGIVISGSTSIIALLFTLLIHRKAPIKCSLFIIICAICQVLMQVTFVYANQNTSISNAIVLQYSSMIFVLIYQSIDHRKMPKPYQIGVILLAFLGIGIFFVDSLEAGGMVGNALAIISGAFFGLQFYLNTKKQAHPYSALIFAFMINIILGVCAYQGELVVLALPKLPLILVVGIIQNGLSGFFFTKGIQTTNAFTANVICMSEILFTSLWGILFLHESFTFTAAIGACLMICALLVNVYMEKVNMKQ